MFKEAWQLKVRVSKKKQKGKGRLESMLKKSVKENDIRVPISHLKNNQYFFGLQKVQVDLQDNNIMLKYNGENITVEEYKEQYEIKMRECVAQYCKDNKIDLEEFAQKAADDNIPIS